MAKAPKKDSAEHTALVKALADILDDAGLAELEYETEDLSVRLSRVTGAAAPVAAVAAPAPVAAAPADAAPADASSHPGAVTSPMVGTAYVAPEPEAPAFVEVGDTVKKGADHSDRRGDESDEPDHRASRRHREADHGNKWSTCGIRRSPGRHRVMFKKILIANRGDVALRVLRACRELNIPNVVVHSTADADSMPVRLADESVCIGPPPSSESYLNVASIITAAGITGADAVHPRVGFLAENADFAEIVAAHGLTFIGPEPRHIRSMGDKVEAKITAAEAGLPLVPGSPGAVHTLEEAKRIGADVGYPLLVKAASGGGGRGMKVAETADNSPRRSALPAPKRKRPLETIPSISSASRPATPYRGSGHRRQPRQCRDHERECRSRDATRNCSRKPSPVLTAEQRAEIGELPPKPHAAWAILVSARWNFTKMASSSLSR